MKKIICHICEQEKENNLLLHEQTHQKLEDQNRIITSLENKIDFIVNLLNEQHNPQIQTYKRFDLYQFGGIDWIVIEQKDNKLLLLSKYILEAKTYNDTRTSIPWGNCTLRDYLNIDFYNRFSDKDKKKIAKTTDNIFLLDTDEVLSYFTNKSEIKAVNKDTGEASRWWLSSFGINDSSAAYVCEEGRVRLGGDYVDNIFGVRPALWIEFG